MYAKNIRPSEKREVQTDRSAERNVRMFRRVRPRRTQYFLHTNMPPMDIK